MSDRSIAESATRGTADTLYYASFSPEHARAPREQLAAAAMAASGDNGRTEREPLLTEAQARYNATSPSKRASGDGQGHDTGETTPAGPAPANAHATAVSEEHSNLQLITILSGVYLGAFVTAVDGTLMATLSAPISSSFSNMPLLGWLAAAFFIASAASQPVAGKLSDIYGRRTGLLFVSMVLILGNLLCAVAQDEWVLMLGRVIAGLGGGAILPISSTIISDLVPLRRRGIWQGVGNIGFGVGSGIGGPVGGWIHDVLDWRWAFVLQVPLTLISMILIAWHVKIPIKPPAVTQGKSKFARIDFAGAGLLVASVILLLLGLISGGNLLPWTHPLVLTSLPLSAVTLVGFVAWEYWRAKEPIIPVQLLANRTVAAVCGSCWFVPMARFGLLFYIPIYFQVRGYSTSETGLRVIPESLATSVGSIGCGLIVRMTGRYWGLSIGSHLMYPIALALIASMTLTSPSWPPFIYLFMGGLAVSGVLTTTLLALLAAVDQSYVAVMTSASYAFRSTGAVIGISIASAVFRNTLRPQLYDRLGHLENGMELIAGLEQELSKIFELPSPLKEDVQQAYMNALHTVFWTLTGISAAGVVSALFMKELHLPKKLSRRPSQGAE